MDPQELAGLLGYGTPSYQQGGIDALSAPITQPGQLDLNGLAAHLGAPDPTAAGPVTSPGQDQGTQPLVPSVSPAPDTTNPSNTGGSASASTQGFSKTKFDQVKKTQGPVDAAIAQDRKDIEAEYEPIKAQEAAATEKQNIAQDAETKAETDKILAMSLAKNNIADAYAGFKNQEETAYAHARAESESAKANYRTALMNYGAAQVNPAQLWDYAGKGGQAGLMTTAFVHDFLGAVGIKTSAMDNIKTAIDHNIESQVESIRRKGQVAAGFKDLWEMQRAQAASDAEARDRMRGFYLKSMENQIDSQMGQYDSQLAVAKGQAAKAALGKAQVQNDLAVQQHIDAAANSRTQQRVAVYGDQLRASIAREQMASAEKIAGIKKGQDATSGLVFDTSKSGQNQAKWRFLPGVQPELQTDVRKKAAATGTAVDRLRELIDLQEKMKSTPDPLTKSELLSEMQRKEEAARSALVESLSLDYSGKVVSDKEAKRIETMVPAKNWFTNGSNVGIISDTLRRKVEETNQLLHQTTSSIEKGDPAFGLQSAPVGDSFASGEITEAGIRGQEDQGAPKDTETDVAIQAITRPDAGKPASTGLIDKTKVIEGGTSPTDDWENFLKKYPKLGVDKEAQNLSDQLGDGETTDPVKPPAAFVGMEALKQHAEKGDPLALEYLTKWAKLGSGDVPQPAPDGSDPNSEESQTKQLYAQWELTHLLDKKKDK